MTKHRITLTPEEKAEAAALAASYGVMLQPFLLPERYKALLGDLPNVHYYGLIPASDRQIVQIYDLPEKECNKS